MWAQAILPLRGKILNIERKDEAALYKNEEIQNLILGLGLGVKVLKCIKYDLVFLFCSFALCFLFKKIKLIRYDMVFLLSCEMLLISGRGF